jgi:FtsH-binding integral membrane protein
VRRALVFGAALLFIAGFAALTLIATAEEGFSLASLVSVLILVLLGVGIVGALRNPPR